MIKVKEYLDEHFKSVIPSTSTIKVNGHYNVQGSWIYPFDYEQTEFIENSEQFYNHLKNLTVISCSCNNETLILRMIVIDGKNVGIYGYLQTYEHLPRGEPDKYGYYMRSTDEEIIKYLNGYYQQINELHIK